MGGTDLQSLYSLTKVVIDDLIQGMLFDAMNSVSTDFSDHFCQTLGRSVQVLSFGRKQARIASEIGKALVDISTAYSVEQRNVNPRTDLFLSPVYRCAYVYRYFVSHTYMVKQFLLEVYCHCVHFRGYFDCLLSRGDVRVCAVGGGPGTDIAALMLFMESDYVCNLNLYHLYTAAAQVISGNYNFRNHPSDAVHQNLSPPGRFPFNSSPVAVSFNPTIRKVGRRTLDGDLIRVFASVLDACPQWQQTADNIFQSYHSNTQGRVCHLQSTVYRSANIVDENFAAQQWPDVQNADFVTMVKAVSAMAGCGRRREVALRSIESIFNQVKPGALVFYMDNAGGGYTEMVVSAASRCGLQVWYRAEHRECVIPGQEDEVHPGSHKTLFKQGPQSRACVTVLLWWKPLTANRKGKQPKPVVQKKNKKKKEKKKKKVKS